MRNLGFFLGLQILKSEVWEKNKSILLTAVVPQRSLPLLDLPLA